MGYQTGHYAILILCLFNITMSAYAVYHSFDDIWRVWKRFTIKAVLELLPLVVVMIGILYLAVAHFPWLMRGWLSLFGSSGNIYFTPLVDLSHSASLLIRLFALICLVIFILSLPLGADWEEQKFRRGRHEWPDIVKASAVFGPIHLLVGIPLVGGVTLTIAGLFYGWKYRQAYLQYMSQFPRFEEKALSCPELAKSIQRAAEDAGIRNSTTYHTLLNTIVLTLIAIMIVVSL